MSVNRLQLQNVERNLDVSQRVDRTGNHEISS